ncbi:hypothetical protein MTQ10_30225 [Streptomyces sp. XM83C]|jgi:hypothetical protein|uniref:Uncharacterized protein n=1 Tax=Streptomyces thermocoprophilus TaxID=78356 RepID=A0ABV5VMA6_9ACTN|nr:hypothetical protein [Streptomyces sp. XM83C]MCK1823741.1 hypothetical protein [Streptomyces sp. XM83C]
MSDASTTQPQDAQADEAQVAAGHGRHRGPVSTQETETAPRGRHRRPVEQAETAAA